MSDKRPPGPLMHESYRPLQMNTGDDRRIYTATYGGPEASLDTRMIITGEMLETLTKVASQSHLGNVTLPHVGLTIDVYRKPDGSQYEVWKFVSRAPTPAKTLRG